MESGRRRRIMIYQIKLHSWTLYGKALPNLFDFCDGSLKDAQTKANTLFLRNPGCPKEIIIYDHVFTKPIATFNNFKKTMPGWAQDNEAKKQRGFL